MDDDCGPDGIAQPGESPCKIEDVKAADRIFVNEFTSLPSASVGLVSYSTTVVSTHNLSQDNESLIIISIEIT